MRSFLLPGERRRELAGGVPAGTIPHPNPHVSRLRYGGESKPLGPGRNTHLWECQGQEVRVLLPGCVVVTLHVL